MPAVSFANRFADAVESGAKCQTIRPYRKGKGQNPVSGATLWLYTGMRTKACRLLREAVCKDVAHIWIDFLNGCVYLDNERLTRAEADELWRADGFGDWQDAYAFFQRRYEGTEHYPLFEGQLTKW